MDEKLQHGIEWVAGATDFVAAAIILTGFLRGLVAFAMAETGPGASRRDRLQAVRCALGTYLLIGLEFMIVSDILHSCVHRDFKSLGELGALVAIRTVISFFLGRELEMVHRVEEQTA